MLTEVRFKVGYSVGPLWIATAYGASLDEARTLLAKFISDQQMNVTGLSYREQSYLVRVEQ